MSPKPINPDSLIKSRIAESLTELLLEGSGYRVVRIAREGLLNGISREDTRLLLKSQSAGQIMTAPPFVVLDKKGENVALVKVKFVSAKSRGTNITHGIGQIRRYWPETLLVVVAAEEPHFSVVDRNQDRVSIEQIFSQIKKETLAQFEGILQKKLN